MVSDSNFIGEGNTAMFNVYPDYHEGIYWEYYCFTEEVGRTKMTTQDTYGTR